MNNANYWLVFLSAVVVLNISPGPDLLYILSRTVTQGRRIGWASSAGVCSGALVHVTAAACGLSAILATSALAFSVVKLAGAAYLFYLGIQALRSKGAAAAVSTVTQTRQVTAWEAYRQGVLIDVLNPKAALFFLAFLPQFVRSGHGSASLQLFGLGLLVIVLALPIEALFVLAAARTTRFFRRSPKVSVWLDRVLGTVFIALGLRLVLLDRH